MAMRSGAVARWAMGASGIALACSLQMPDEEELFGENGKAGRGGSAAGMNGESGRSGADVGGSGGNIAPSDAGASGEAGAGGAGGEAGSQSVAGTGGGNKGGSVSAIAGAGGASGEAGASGAGGEGGSGPPLVDFDPLDGLVAHYRFDDGAGTVAADEVTPPRDGTVHGPVTWVANGKIGGALRLSGQQAYVDLPNGIMLPLDELTISVWFNKDTATLWQRLFDFGSSQRNFFYYAPNAAAALTGELGARAAVDVTDTLTVDMHMPAHIPPAAKWNHLVITWTQAQFYVYLNGVEAGYDETPIVTPGNHEAMTPATESWHNWIGRSNFAVDPYFVGLVDDFRVYNRALLAEEVRALNAVAE